MTKYIRYTKYTGEPADGVDLQELIKRLSDFFLQSGYESQFYGMSEMDPEKSMEALRQAIQRAIEGGDLLPNQELQDLLDGTPEQMDAKMKELIDQLIDRLMQEGYVTGQPQVTAPPDKTPRGQVGQGRDRIDRPFGIGSERRVLRAVAVEAHDVRRVGAFNVLKGAGHDHLSVRLDGEAREGRAALDQPGREGRVDRSVGIEAGNVVVGR